jgi:DNA polymerase-3 subunit epsilon
MVFGTLAEGKAYLEKISEQYRLCNKLNGLYKTDTNCFQFMVGLCSGACTGIESAESYNLRTTEFINTLGYLENNCIIKEQGRTPEEIALIGIRGGQFVGIGFFDKDEVPAGLEAVFESLTPYVDNRDVRSILNAYLAKPAGKVIKRF